MEEGRICMPVKQEEWKQSCEKSSFLAQVVQKRFQFGGMERIITKFPIIAFDSLDE